MSRTCAAADTAFLRVRCVVHARKDSMGLQEGPVVVVRCPRINYFHPLSDLPIVVHARLCKDAAAMMIKTMTETCCSVAWKDDWCSEDRFIHSEL